MRCTGVIFSQLDSGGQAAIGRAYSDIIANRSQYAPTLFAQVPFAVIAHGDIPGRLFQPRAANFHARLSQCILDDDLQLYWLYISLGLGVVSAGR